MAKPHKYRDQYRIRWMDHAGVRRCELHASFRDADRALHQHVADANAIKVGAKAAPPPVRTFSDACDYWIANRAATKRSGKDDESIIRCHLRPALGALKLMDIGVGHTDALRVAKKDLAPKTVLNIMILLGSIMRAAMELGWVIKLPPIHKPKVRLFSKQYRYLSEDDEVLRLLAAAREDGEDAFVLYATAIYTGMREGELAGLRWSSVKFNQKLIVVEYSYDGPTKPDDVHYVPILDVLMPILRQWKVKKPGEFVFENEAGGMLQPCSRIFAERLHRILDAAGFVRPTTGRYIHAIHFHALRHTFASHWVMKDGDIFKLQKILGHKSIEMTMRYAHLKPNAFAGDLGRFSDMATPGPSEVVGPRVRWPAR